MTWATEITADNPLYWHKFQSAVDNMSNAGTLVAGIVGANEAVDLAFTQGYYSTLGAGVVCQDGDAFTVELVFKTPAVMANRVELYYQPATALEKSFLTITADGRLQHPYWFNLTSSSGLLVADTWYTAAVVYNGVDTLYLYLNGAEVDSAAAAPALMTTLYANGSDVGPSSPMFYINGHKNAQTAGWFPDEFDIDGNLADELVTFEAALTPARLAAHATALGLQPPQQPDILDPVLPITWSIQDTLDPYLRIIWNIAATLNPVLPITWSIKDTLDPVLPIRWEIPTTVSPALPITWSIIDWPNQAASAVAWHLVVKVNGVDISDRLVDQVRIAAEETASTLADVVFLPDPGVIDPATWENMPLTIDFCTRDSAGVLRDQVRRFTGKVSRARYDPDGARVKLRGTTDLQGRLEATDQAHIDTLIDAAYWSPFVFDESVDGWQYAQDRLSTRPAELHIDAEGFLRVADWAAGAPAITFTDATRFADTLEVERVTRRDLVNQVSIAFDFRFVRLRQRELTVRIAYPFDACEFMLRAFDVLQRAQVQAVADSGRWSRLGEIEYTPFFEPGTYMCSNDGGARFPVVFAGAGVDYSGLCLGAAWRAARRWAQTITETATINVRGSDSVDAVGAIGFAEDYNLAAEYDATAWETESFDGRRAGGALNSAGDYIVDADTIAARGRVEFEQAQQCAIAKARTTILERHRRNRVRFAPVYRPDMSLDKTVRVDTPDLAATGKVYGYVETFDLVAGWPALEVTLAISRHSGAGLAVDDPIAAAPLPTPTVEALQPGGVTLGYYIGGDPDSPAQVDDWQGFITNRQVPTDLNTLYDPGLVFEYPAIEAAARDAVGEVSTLDVDVDIPLDELTMGA